MVEHTLKNFITRSLEDGFVCDFQNGIEFRMLQTVSIFFLKFFHHFIMLTDTILDCWLPYREKGA